MKKIFLSLMVAMSAGLLCLAQNCNTNFPNADIASAQRLYKFEVFTVPNLGAAGSNPNEIDLSIVTGSKLKETHAAWYAFDIKDGGDLTFKIEPLVASDDIDFVLYKEVNSVWQVVRTSASGPLLNAYRTNSANVINEGTLFRDTPETGTNSNSVDTHELDGYNNDLSSSNGYVEKIPVLSNEKFRLVVNNYFSCDGFTVTWNNGSSINAPTLKPCTSLSVTPVLKHYRACDTGGEISLNINGNGNYAYQWSNNTTTASLQNPLANVVYHVTVTDTDNSGCSKILNNLQLENYQQPVFSPIANKNLTCSAIVVTTNVNPVRDGQSYIWQGLNGDLPSTTATLSVNAPNTISVTLIDSESRCSVTQTFNVTGSIGAVPVTNITINGNISCLKPNTQVSVNNLCTGCTVNWTSASGTGFNGTATATGATVTVTKEGDYTATMVNTNQCSNVVQFTVNKDVNAPIFTLPTIVPIPCINPSTNIEITNIDNPTSSTYAWSASNGGIIQGNSSGTKIIVIAKGIYNITATNNITGCKTVKSVQADVPNIVVSGVAHREICHGTTVQLVPTIYAE